MSGHFGHWATDDWGLPAYHYTCDHKKDPRAVYLAMGGEHRRHWHQIGNDRIIAIGDNDGCVQVYQGEGGAKWLNFHSPEELQFAGGLGYLTDGRDVLATHFNDPKDITRIFGIGYYRKIAKSEHLTLDQLIFAPFGDHPLLISQVRIENHGPTPVDLDYFEYWGSYQYQLAYDAFITSYGARDHKVRDASRAELSRTFCERIVFDPSRKALLSTWKHPDHDRRPEGPDFHDLEPPASFLACLDAEPAAHETDARKFLGQG